MCLSPRWHLGMIRCLGRFEQGCAKVGRSCTGALNLNLATAAVIYPEIFNLKHIAIFALILLTQRQNLACWLR